MRLKIADIGGNTVQALFPTQRRHGTQPVKWQNHHEHNQGLFAEQTKNFSRFDLEFRVFSGKFLHLEPLIVNFY